MPNREHGEGTIYERKDGRWQAAIQVDGVRKVVYGKTERDARRKLVELRRETSVGPLPSPGTRTVNDLLDLWLETVRTNLKPTTVQWYAGMAGKHIRPSLGKVRLSKLEPAHVQRLCVGLEGRTAKAIYSTLHRACTFGVLWRWLASNPADRMMAPAYQSPRKAIWGRDELRTFLDATLVGWLGPFWTLAVATGCRVGELLALQWPDVDWAAGSISVRGSLQRVEGEWIVSTPKTRAGERTIALPREATDALRRQQVQQAEWRLRAGERWLASGYVFTGETGGPVSRWTIDHALARESERLALPKLTPHSFRHLHASLLLDAGLSVPAVSARLGHARPSITMAIYAHSMGDGDRKAADVLARALGGGGTSVDRTHPE